MFQNQSDIYIEVQFNPFPDQSPQFSMLLLEGDDEHPIIYYSDKDKSLHEDALTDDYDGKSIFFGDIDVINSSLAYRNSKTFHRITLNTAHIATKDKRMRYYYSKTDLQISFSIRYFAVYKLFKDLMLYPDTSHVVSYTIRARVSSSSNNHQTE